jgi:hypothetical protein
MKKIIFTLLLSFGLSLLWAQDFVKPEDVTVENVAKHLQTKGYKIAEQTDNFIKIELTDESPVYLDFSADKKYILFNVSNALVDNADSGKNKFYLMPSLIYQ